MSRQTRDEEEQALKLFVVLSRATRAITDRVYEDIRSYGLNPTEFAVMELLYHKGDQPIQQIGKKVLLTSGSITYVVDKLERKNLLQRRACPQDRRVTYAAITDAGAERMHAIFPKHRQAIHEICAALDTKEQAVLIELLKKIGLHAQKL